MILVERTALERLPDVHPRDLADAWRSLLFRARLSKHHRVTREELSVREHMSIILKRLQGSKFVEFSDLFDHARGTAVAVVHFLALLELARMEAATRASRDGPSPRRVLLAAILLAAAGLEHCYPTENRRLLDRIVAGRGAVFSELPLDTPPAAEHFPRRNRIIAGLADATVVVEAGERSGALITAGWAMEQGRGDLLLGHLVADECRRLRLAFLRGLQALLEVGHLPVLQLGRAPEVARALGGIDLGFVPDRVLTMQVTLPGARYDTGARVVSFFDELQQRVGAAVGAEAAR